MRDRGQRGYMYTREGVRADANVRLKRCNICRFPLHEEFVIGRARAYGELRGMLV